MDLPIGTPVLNMNSPTFAEDLATLLGVAPGDTLEIRGPQFERVDGMLVDPPPKTAAEWASLKDRPLEELKLGGFGVWDQDEKEVHLLFPREWYNFIPEGFPITFIQGDTGRFQPGVTDDDYRFGYLAFGFVKALK